jgi:hypothetical protein
MYHPYYHRLSQQRHSQCSSHADGYAAVAGAWELGLGNHKVVNMKGPTLSCRTPSKPDEGSDPAERIHHWDRTKMRNNA